MQLKKWLDILVYEFVLIDKFDFYCVWLDCTPEIFFCLNFRTFLCHLARYWHQIWGIDLYWHNTENFSLLYPFMYSFWSYASLKFVGAGRGHVLLQQYLQYACLISWCLKLFIREKEKFRSEIWKQRREKSRNQFWTKGNNSWKSRPTVTKVELDL